MVKQLIQIIFIACMSFHTNYVYSSQDDMTIRELVLGDKKDFHLKILKAIPKTGQIIIGPEDAENTIIEFFDYKCGYCVKMHSELVELANTRNDTKVVFLQFPIISEMSAQLSRIVLAAKFQNKGFDLHHAILTQRGSITENKINKILKDLKIDSKKIKEDLNRPEIDDALNITSFMASVVGARGTPAIFINNEFNPGYLSKSTIEKLLK